MIFAPVNNIHTLGKRFGVGLQFGGDLAHLDVTFKFTHLVRDHGDGDRHNGEGRGSNLYS